MAARIRIGYGAAGLEKLLVAPIPIALGWEQVGGSGLLEEAAIGNEGSTCHKLRDSVALSEHLTLLKTQEVVQVVLTEKAVNRLQESFQGVPTDVGRPILDRVRVRSSGGR